MKFEFAKYTDVTGLALKVNPEYEANHYERVFLCSDTKVFWIARILTGFGEDYEPIDGSYIVEREQVSKSAKSECLTHIKAIDLLEGDSFENWDYTVCDSIEEAIELIDDGCGINDLIEVSK